MYAQKLPPRWIMISKGRCRDLPPFLKKLPGPPLWRARTDHHAAPPPSKGGRIQDLGPVSGSDSKSTP